MIYLTSWESQLGSLNLGVSTWGHPWSKPRSPLPAGVGGPWNLKNHGISSSLCNIDYIILVRIKLSNCDLYMARNAHTDNLGQKQILRGLKKSNTDKIETLILDKRTDKLNLRTLIETGTFLTLTSRWRTYMPGKWGLYISCTLPIFFGAVLKKSRNISN